MIDYHSKKSAHRPHDLTSDQMPDRLGVFVPLRLGLRPTLTVVCSSVHRPAVAAGSFTAELNVNQAGSGNSLQSLPCPVSSSAKCTASP